MDDTETIRPQIQIEGIIQKSEIRRISLHISRVYILWWTLQVDICSKLNFLSPYILFLQTLPYLTIEHGYSTRRIALKTIGILNLNLWISLFKM